MRQTCHQAIFPNIWINFQAQFYVHILSLLMLIGKILNLSHTTLTFQELFFFHIAFSLKSQHLCGLHKNIMLLSMV